MPLVTLKNVHVAFGSHALLDSEDFQIDPGERVGLLGRNGEGKSTLMKLIAGKIEADSGEVWRQPTLKLALLTQIPQISEDKTIYDAVANGFGEIGHWLAQYHELSISEDAGQPWNLRKLSRLQQQLETHDGWLLEQRVESTLSQFNLDGDLKISTLSGGMRRRVDVATAMVIQPDLLLLDEPTNHLDIETIAWFEEQILQFGGSVLFVTHDRVFLDKIATRIVDLDRGQLVSWPGDYSGYLQNKATAIEEENKQNAEFDKKLAQEEVWIRQGIKARRTRNEGRVRALKKMRDERSQRREQQAKAKFSLENAEVSGKRVIKARSVAFGYQDKPIVRDFSATIVRGDRIGLIGANGSGKSTLLKLLLGELQPNSGTIKHGTNLEMAYFDQLRNQLDPDTTAADAVADGNEFVVINGNKRHIMSYMMDFLFSPDQARSLVRSLSGGEKNRLMLARLFAKPANLLVMDEPTNDLDIETLELLEEILIKFNGTILLVSHDREFIDNVVTSTLVFGSDANIKEYVGGYEDWLRQRPKAIPTTKEPKVTKKKLPPKTKRKLGYKERQELEELPTRIDAMEGEQTTLHELVSSDDFYRQNKEDITRALESLKALEIELEQAYSRWGELEALASEFEKV